MAIASLTIAHAEEGKRYVVQPGAPVATSVEGLRQGKVTINPDYIIVYGVKVNGTPPDVLAFSKNYDRTGKIYYVAYKYAPEKFGRYFFRTSYIDEIGIRFVLSHPLPFHANNARSRPSLFGPVAPQFGQTP